LTLVVGCDIFIPDKKKRGLFIMIKLKNISRVGTQDAVVVVLTNGIDEQEFTFPQMEDEEMNKKGVVKKLKEIIYLSKLSKEDLMIELDLAYSEEVDDVITYIKEVLEGLEFLGVNF
jgi:Trk K+ transport system NAD-binding subunit